MVKKVAHASKARKRKATPLVHTAHVFIPSDRCFTGADAARLLAIVGLPRTAGLDDDQAALQLDAVVAEVMGWGRFQRELPKPSETIRQLQSIERKANALLDALGYRPENEDPYQFLESLTKPYHSLLSPRPGDHKLPTWIGTGLGLLPRFADACDRGRKSRPTFDAESPEPALPEPTPADLESQAIAGAASDMLAEFPRYLKILAILADVAAHKAKDGSAAREAGPAKSSRPIELSRSVLFQGLAGVHFDAFGCWPKMTGDAMGERNGPAVQWVKAVIDHAVTYLRSHALDPADVQVIAQRNVGADAISEALRTGTDTVRGERT